MTLKGLQQRRGKSVRGKTALLAVSAFLIALWGFGALDRADFADASQSEETAEAKDKTGAMILDSVTSATTRYEPVEFTTHDKHAEAFNCRTCHNDISNNDETPASCSSCHNKPGAKASLMKAMHTRCRGCHIKQKEKNKESEAPVSCLGCHTERTGNER